MTQEQRLGHSPDVAINKETDLSGQVAIITGSSRGIGRAIAIKLASHGANVVINSTDQSIPEAEEVKATIEKAGGRAIIVTGDVTKTETAKKIIDETIKAFGKIDILVNNVGTTRDNLLVTIPDEDYDKVMNTNLKSAFLMTKAVIRQMIRQKSGKIINISSISGQLGIAGQTIYGASKAALEGFTRSAATEYAKRGIRVNAVALGFVDTDLTEDVKAKRKEEIMEQTPMGRPVTLEEAANSVLFFASDMSSAITGQTLNVDGGMVRK